MRVVVMGCDGAGSRYHYITGYHGPQPDDGPHIGPKHVVVNSL